MSGDVEYIFVLRFNVGYDPSEIVWSDSSDMIEEFIKQHGMRRECLDISIMNKTSLEGCPLHLNDDNRLVEYKMGSNTDGKIKTIVTAECYLTDALQGVSEELADSMVFGDAIVRTDIQVIDRIQKLVDQLHYGLVFDYSILDDRNFNGYNSEDSRMYPYDMSIVCDAIYASSTVKDVQPITYEAYAHYFAHNIARST